MAFAGPTAYNRSTMSDSGNIHFTIVDGTRQPISSQTQVLVRLLNGAKPIPAKWAAGSDITITGIEFTDTGEDAYNVFASINGFDDAVSPNRVPIIPGKTSEVALLATPKHGKFHFLPWSEFQKQDPRIVSLFTNGVTGDPGQQYSDFSENDKQNLAFGCLINLATAIRDIPLDDRASPFDNFYWEVMWDQIAQDRFYAWVDATLAGHIDKLSQMHAFAPELHPEVFHKGIPGIIDPATHSWKQTRFDVTNVQLTFHETTRSRRKDAGGNMVDCVVIEPDIDLFKDLVSHGLAEVVPNALTGGKTDPRTVYAMRWMATRQEENVAEFAPPVTIEA